jgi:hypothetical protein
MKSKTMDKFGKTLIILTKITKNCWTMLFWLNEVSKN